MALLAAAIAASPFAIEFGLWVAGTPPGEPIQIAHPPNETTRRKTFEFDTEFKTNGRGLRYAEIPSAKPAGERRIFVAGDSYTEGWGVEAGEAFPAGLETAFSREGAKARFINGGLTGKGPLDYARLFHFVGTRYQPDGLLICLYANDVRDTNAAARPEDVRRGWIPPLEEIGPGGSRVKRVIARLWPRTFFRAHQARKNLGGGASQAGVGDSGSAAKTPTPGPGKVEVRRDILNRILREGRKSGVSEERLAAWRKGVDPRWIELANQGLINWFLLIFGLYEPEYFSDGIDIDRPEAEAKYRAMTGILDEMIREAKSRGIKAGVVFVPCVYMHNPESFRPDATEPEARTGMIVRKAWLTGPTEIEKRLAAWTRERSLPFLNLTPDLRAAPEGGRDLTFPFDGHLNPRGHAFVAERVGKWIRDEKVFDLGR